MTREEAINEIKSWSLNQDDMEVLSVAIPELKESEDERTRKAIITYLSNELHNVKQLTPRTNEFEDWIAYLEKQKEQKTLSTEETKLNSIPSLEQLGYTCVSLGAKQKPILEVFGFKVGDAVRLKDGDGRKHIIKSFEEVEGLHGPNFYHVEFEDDSARDSIYPGEEYPNGYYTQMEKFEEEQKSAEWNDTDMKEARNNLISVCRDWECGKQTTLLPIAAVRARYFLEHITEPQPKQEWSEEDKKQFNIVLDSLRYAYEDLNNNKSFDTANVVKKAFDWMQYCFKSLHPQKLDASKLENFDPVDVLNRIKTEWPMAWDKVVPKQEWSEEDRDNLERVDNYLWMLDDYVGDDCAMPQGKTDKIRGNIQGILSSWLKSLPDRFNLQPKQEWSEEDKRNIDRAVFYVRYYQRTNGNTDGSKECIDWLKSLRPIWKPSEEQMHYLKKVYDSYDFCDGERSALESLYEQLEKLM